ncbi:MAG TPA: TrkA family potassium uptake protein [Streptosporangiaceae bacterium]|jgi:trk system potassium uptake protein TrkA|nr:TrkA family potassium uptake protein [Streptosporangiaceae bacterium]
MHIVVTGGGLVGRRVTQAVHAAGNTVAIVEKDPARAAELAAQGLQVVTGNACAPGRLEAAGALRADVLVAATGRDEDNLIISLLGRRRFEIPRIVATVRDDANRWLFDPSWGVDAAISAASALVTLIEEATGSAQTIRLADLAGSGLTLVETNITAMSAARGKTIAGLHLRPGDTVATVIRRGKTLHADPALRLRTGDRILVVTGPDGENHVHDTFYPPADAKAR